MSREVIKAEIESLKRNDGLIVPADVVEAARDEGSPLHGHFQWDDTEAGHQYRLLQARQLIRVYVHAGKSDDESEPVRAFVSLTTDRVKSGGGYRTIAEVMSDDQLREQMLADALTRLKNIQQQYRQLAELSKVWEAVEAAEKKQTPSRSKRQRAQSMGAAA